MQVATDMDWMPSARDVGEWANAAIRVSGGIPDGHVGVTVRLVSEAESKSLNARFRGIRKATNVLAFPAGAAMLPPESATRELGDLAICSAIVQREAARQSKEPRDHLAHMVIHGILHLLGYDHIGDADAKRMEACEKQVMEMLGYQNPYATESRGIGQAGRKDYE